MRNASGAETAILLTLIIILLAGVVGLKAAGDVAYHKGLIQGAKIGIAADSPDSYRADQVRGACENVFTADECIMCHEF